MGFQQQLFDVIQQLTGQRNLLTIPRTLIQYTGDIQSALLLSQLIYWSDRSNNDGWIFKTYKEWEDEIFLSEYEVRKSRKHLENIGILETKIKKANGNPTVHYKVNINIFLDSFLKNLKERNLKNSINESLNTKETLTEPTPNITQKKNIYESEFEIWWEGYPKKSGKADARKAWTKLRKSGKTIEELTLYRDRYIAKIHDDKTEKQYVLHGSTFLNGRWEDYKEVEQVQHQQQFADAAGDW